MMLERSDLGMKKGYELVDALLEGEFPKNKIKNHGVDFTDGYEGLYRYKFVTYISSCGYLLMENRLKKDKGEYHG